jgi:hypothetical protein
VLHVGKVGCSPQSGIVVIVPGFAIIVLTLVDLAEHHNTWELCLWVIRDLGVEGEDAHATAILRGHIFEGLLDQHGGYEDLLLYDVFMLFDEAIL